MSSPLSSPNSRSLSDSSVGTRDYAWLEEETPAVHRWQAAQNEATDRFLAGCTAGTALAAHIERSFANVYAHHAPRFAGGRWFWQRNIEGKPFDIVQVADDLSGPWRTLVDLNRDYPPEQSASLLTLSPSPDGRKLIYEVNLCGQESQLNLIEVDSGEFLLKGYERPGLFFCAWTPDGRGFYYSGMTLRRSPDGSESPGLGIFHHRLGFPRPTEALPLRFAHPAAWPMSAGDGRHTLLFMDQTAARPVYLRDESAEVPEWRPFLDHATSSFRGDICGNEFVAVTTDGAPRGRIVAIPLDAANDRSRWREILPEGASTLASVTAVGGRLVVGEFVDAAARLRVLDLEGHQQAIVPLPATGAAGRWASGHIASLVLDLVYAGADCVTFTWSSLTQSPAVYCYDIGRNHLWLLTEPSHRIADVEETSHSGQAADGTHVPYRVVRRRGTGLPAPTLLTGYGGFNVPMLPAYFPLGAAWLEAGGILVIGNFRGGGEFGEDFWKAGRRDGKQHSFDDAHAVAEDLAARGICRPEQLGLMGSSNGGLLAGVAVTQRPELFGAVVPQVPILDLLGLVRDARTLAVAMVEYGRPDVACEAAWLRHYSPCHNVRHGQPYPAVFIDASIHDTTCPPWHARKFAAQLLDAGSQRHVLLRVRASGGHNIMTEADFKARDLEELAFLARELGLEAKP